MPFVRRAAYDNPTTTMSGADDARKIDDALLRAFCAVQALCAGAIGIAYPAVLCALATCPSASAPSVRSSASRTSFVSLIKI